MHTVFVLGAGASRKAGAPLMADFIDRASLRYAVETDSRFKLAFESVFRAIADLQAVHAKAFLDTDNIEALFGAVEMGMLINKFGTHQPSEISVLRESLVSVIVRTLEYSMPFPSTEHRISPPAPYGSFAALLKKYLQGHGESRHTFGILTFNYDIALDFALYSQGLRYDYRLVDGNQQPRSLSLLKLHGSINWGVCDRCQEITPIDFGEVHFDLYRSQGHVTFDVGSKIHAFVNHCSQPATKPFLVPPTWNKTADHHRLANVWRSAADELGRAENVIVIGYSLPDTDAFFRYLLALGSQSATRLRRFWVMNPDQDGLVQARFREITGRGISSRVRFFDRSTPDGGRFEDCLTNIEAALEERD